MSGPSEDFLLRQLAREIRSFDGMERTPAQCRVHAIRQRDNGKSKLKGLTLGAYICRILDDPDMLEALAKSLRLTDQDTIPSSAELGIV